MRLALIGTVLLVCALAAMPGLSQPTEAESNDSRLQADYIAHVPGSGCRAGAIGRIGDIDHYRFTVTKPVLVYITTVTNGDTVIALQDSQGRSISQDDDSGSGSASKLALYLDPGMYYVAVWEYGNDGTIGEYTLLVSSSGHSSESEGNNDIWSADPIGSIPGAAAASGSISRGDQDWYRFEVSGSTQSCITTVTSGDTVVALYNSSGAMLIDNDDSGGARWSLISNYGLNVATYYVKVWEYGDDAAIDRYMLLVGSSYADEGGAHTSKDVSQPIDLRSGSGMVRGSVASQAEADWYSFSLDPEALVTVSAYSVYDTLLKLYDESGELLDENDDVAPGASWSQIDRFLSKGTYYVEVIPYPGRIVSSYVLAIVPQ